MSVPHTHIRRGVSCTLCPAVPLLPVVTTPVLPPPPAVLWRLEVRGREVYCDAARYAHICIPVEPDSGTYVFITPWPPYGVHFAHYSNTAEKRFIHSVPLHSASALLPRAFPSSTTANHSHLLPPQPRIQSPTFTLSLLLHTIHICHLDCLPRLQSVCRCLADGCGLSDSQLLLKANRE